MKIGIVSDTHNNFDVTSWAIDEMAQRNIRRVFHCGDITTPLMVELFAPFETTFVLGNMDRERAALRNAAKGQATFSFTTELNDVTIGMTHGHMQNELDNLINTGTYDLVFHGHTHLRRDDRIGQTRVINPGALGGSKKQSRSFCVIDLNSTDVTFVEKT